LLTLCGSLKPTSANARLLDLAEARVPAGWSVGRFAGLAKLPAFDPSLDEAAPAAVEDWRAQVKACDALLIATPEYAHGVPGALKNALDWMVGSGELVGKPVGLLLGSTTDGRFALEGLREVLRTMSAQVVPDAVLPVPGVKTRLEDAALADQLTAVVTALTSAAVAK
jgi:NAD(P)H-dependent FMN reductase